MGTNQDPNPAKYLSVYGDEPRFTSALRDLDHLDSTIGDTTSGPSHNALILYLNTLLAQKEDEIQERIQLIQERDKELNRLYLSKRYRIGHCVVRPLEVVLSVFRSR